MTPLHPGVAVGRAVTTGAVALLLSLGAIVGIATGASAHAVLVGSDPPDGARLDAAPETITLTFSEVVEAPPQAVRVFDSDGERVDAGDAEVAGEQIVASLTEGLGEGTYTVSWRAISEDSHPISGAIVFVVGAGSEGAGGDEDAAPSPAAIDLLDDGVPAAFGPLAALGRIVRYAGVLVAAGAVAFLLLVHDGRRSELARMQRIVVYSALLAAVATIIGVPLQAGIVTGLGLAATADPDVLTQVLGSTYGISALTRLAGLTVLIVGVSLLPQRVGALLAGAGAVAALVSFALTGHTASTEPRALVTVANIAHTSAAAIWTGGLVLLALVLVNRRRADAAPAAAGPTEAAGVLERPTPAGHGGAVPVGGVHAGPSGPPAPASSGTAPRSTATVERSAAAPTAEHVHAGARMVARYSTLALASVAVLLVAGTALSVVQVGSVEALVTTRYGWTLSAKILLVLVILTGAIYNNRRLVPAVRRGSADAWGRLLGVVRLELVGILAVVALTGVLVSFVPARADVGPGLFDGREALGGEASVQLVVDPARPGSNEMHIYLLDTAGRIADLDEQEVTVRFALPAADIAPIERDPTVAGPGHYVHVGEELSIAGTWTVEVRVLIDDFTVETTSFEVPVG